jgi:general secretion pathway protein L
LSQSILGLDIGRNRIKAVRLETTFKGFAAVEYAEHELPAAPPLPPPNEEGEVIEPPGFSWLDRVRDGVHTLLTEHELEADLVVTAVPGDRVTTRIIELPFKRAREIEMVLGPELEEHLPMELEDIVYDYQVLTETDAGSKLLVAIVDRVFFGEFLAMLQSVGVDPRMVSVTGLAKADLFSRMSIIEDGPLMVCDIGHAGTTMTVIRHGRPAMWRASGRGARHVQDAIAAVDSEQPEAVSAAIGRAIGPALRDIKHTFLAAQGVLGEDVRAVYLCGGGAQLGGLGAFLEQSLGVDVVRLEPSAAPFNQLPEAEKLDSLVCEALGLAMRALPGADEGIDLRTGEFAFKGEYQYLRGRVAKLALAVCALIISMGGLAYSQHYALNIEEMRNIAQLKARTKVILGQELSDFDQAVRLVERGKKAQKNPIPRRDAYALLHALSVSMGDDLAVDLDRFEVDLDRERAEVRGRTTSATEVQTIVERLGSIDCFKSVETERNEKGTDQKQVFHMTMKLEGC